MFKSLRIRLLPNQKQEEKLWKHVNGARFIWNYGLGYQMQRYNNYEKHLSGYDLRKVLINLKQQNRYEWLKEISGHTISNVCLDLDLAYKHFFKNIKNKPRFKKKNKCKKSFPCRQDTFYFLNSCAIIEKIGHIKYQTNYNLPQGKNKYRFLNPRIHFDNEKWILSFVIEFEKQERELNNFSMGIDLGIKELAVVAYSDKQIVFKNINKTKKVKTLNKKLLHLQRKVSRKYETNNNKKTYEDKWYKSNNILKTEKQIKKIYYRLSNIRRDYIHQTTHKLIKLSPKKVIMEDLNISGMIKNRHLSKAIQEQCLYEFIRQTKYKCEWNGIEFKQVDRFFPSSKICSNCGCIKSDLKLSDRVYKCEQCGFEIDRDYNAAMNLMNSNV